jgi:hypothetical protein
LLQFHLVHSSALMYCTLYLKLRLLIAEELVQPAGGGFANMLADKHQTSHIYRDTIC